MEDGLDTILGDTNDTVSGGQRSRINLARCFYQNPDIYLLDDPTSSLDNNTIKRIMGNLKSAPEFLEKTFVFTTNDTNLLKFADKLLFVQDGMIMFQGTYSNL